MFYRLHQRQILIAAFFVLFMAVPVLSMAGTVNLPQTGQTTCYDVDSTIVDCAGTGQDGDELIGVAWPSPRFTDNGDSTVTDNLTGLEWTQDANLPGASMTWQEALDYVAVMNAGGGTFGHTDWRLPNVNELESIVNAEEANLDTWLNGQGFTNVQSDYYWSSTSDATDTTNAWSVVMSFGYVYIATKDSSVYVWPVRSGGGGSFDNSDIWQTGQTSCYDESGNVIDCTGTGQDGEIQAGTAWPSPRFTDNGNSTVTDNLTGLVWTQDGNLSGGTKTWQEALDYVAGMNAETNANFGYTDWLLPNRKELFSLIDYTQNFPALPSGHPFTNVELDSYWSSTSLPYTSSVAWYVLVTYGYMLDYDKSSSFLGNGILLNVWPVRLGASDMSVSPASHGFGYVTMGDTSTAQSFTVSNNGEVGLVIGTISLTGTDAAGFSIQNDSCSGQTVAVSGSCTVEVVFSPTVESIASANLTIPTNDPDTPTLDVPLSGASTCIYSISPTSNSVDSSSDTGSVSVTAASGCIWDTVSNDSWITIDSGSTGDGDGTVDYFVSENTSTSSRTGTMTIADETFTVTQTPPEVPTLDIKANDSDGTVDINNDGDQLSIAISLDPGGYTGTLADWYIVVNTPSGWQSFNISQMDYSISGLSAIAPDYGIKSIGPAEIFSTSSLSAGTYIYYFVVIFSEQVYYYDSVTVEVWDISAPTGFTASASDNTLTLSWDTVSGADGYNLYYGLSSGDYVGSVDLGNTTGKSFSGMPAGTFYFAIKAYVDSVESDYSNEGSVTFY